MTLVDHRLSMKRVTAQVVPSQMIHWPSEDTPSLWHTAMILVSDGHLSLYNDVVLDDPVSEVVKMCA